MAALIGCDIVEIARFRRMPYDRNIEFYNRWFTDEEVKRCLSKKDPYAHFAAIFAAKEAAIKASRGELTFLDVEVVENHEVEEVRSEGYDFMLSTSFNEDYAIAMVLGEINHP